MKGPGPRAVWRLELSGGQLRRVEEPALRVPRGSVAIKVKAFLADDYTQWSLRRGEGAPSRWAYGVVLSGGEVGRHVVALVDNAAAQYAASRLYVPAEPDPSSLEAAAVAYVVEALRWIPRVPVAVLGDDPRRRAVERLAEVEGRSRWAVALQGARIAGVRAVAVSRLVELEGNAAVRLVDVPSRWALERALALKVRLGLPRVPLEAAGWRWEIVLLE